MGVKTFRKQGTVQALQFIDTPERIQEIIEWAEAYNVIIRIKTVYANDRDYVGQPHLEIPTLEGIMYAPPGAWVCKGVEDEFWFVKESIFEKTYQEV